MTTVVTTYIGETYIADDSVQFLFREGFINLFENDLQKAYVKNDDSYWSNAASRGS